MTIKQLLSVAAAAIVLVACKEPNRDTLSYQALPAFDIVKAIQNKDFEVFSRLLAPSSDANQNFNNLAQFQKLCDAFGRYSEGYEGWDMRRNDILSRLISREVEKDEKELQLTSRLEEVAYDIYVLQKIGKERKTTFVARIYAQGKTYRQLKFYRGEGRNYWAENLWQGGSWLATKISVPGMTDEDFSNQVTESASVSNEQSAVIREIPDAPTSAIANKRPLY